VQIGEAGHGCHVLFFNNVLVLHTRLQQAAVFHHSFSQKLALR
jgi:hypothetical protein